MYGHPSRYRPAGGGGGRGMPPAQPPAPPLNPNLFHQNPNVYNQNSTFPFHQNPNFPVQNPNFPPQQFANLGFQPQSRSQNPKEALERIDRAVVKARHDIIAAGESVLAWKVSQAALLTFQVDSWSSLGFQMQDIPSLHRLIVTEGKINAFIQCFVGVRKITSLYDLEVAICKNEGVAQFEELELGPLVRHPLVVHYFSVNSDVTGVHKITSEEIFSFLCEFMDAHKNKYIKAEEFLDFIANKQLVTSREKLGVRIQNLGMHVAFILEATRLEDATLKRYVKGLKRKSDKRSRKRPLIATQKQQLDERFSAISQRIKSFPSVQVDFGGKHIRFVSSSSEDLDSDDHKSVDDNHAHSDGKFSLQSTERCDRVSSCPYPSAIEEMSRLGLKGETDSHPSASSSFGYNGSNRPVRKKRKSENLSCSVSAPAKLPKRDKVKLDRLSMDDYSETKELSDLNEADLTLDNNSMRMFTTAWKDACRDQTVAEVFERMLQFYHTPDRQRKLMKSMFSSYPCIGFLNITVTSIKCGMWDSIYDTFQAINQHGLCNTLSEYESIDVEPNEKNALVIEDRISEHRHSVTAEDIIRKLAMYFEFDHVNLSSGKLPIEKKLVFFRELCNCEVWLMEQFSVKEFKSLGYGDFFTFLENNVSLLPSELLNCLLADIGEKSSFEVCMLQHQLVVLLAQASNSLWENETITKRKISSLLMRQFPLIGFNIIENGPTKDLLDIVREQKSSVISNCVLFSITLFGTCYNGDSLDHNDKDLFEIAGVRTNICEKAGTLGPVSSKDAVEALLRAPMLSDLNSWSHWDLIFAPSLGPLVRWLLNEVNTKEFLCLVTKDGKVVRVNSLATLDSFLEASLKGSSFQTAVELVSLFSLSGGKRHVPLSLLKCHARQAFEVILKNSMDNQEANDGRNFLMHGKEMCKKQTLGEDATFNLGSELHKNIRRMNEALPVASRFILDCLGYLPSEFRGFAADVLLSGLQYVIKDAPSAILCECNQTEERIMLHEVGLLLGIVEWINDYNAFCSTAVAGLLNSSGASHLKTISSEISSSSTYKQDAMDMLPSSEGEMGVSVKADRHNEECSEVCQVIDRVEVTGNSFGSGCMQHVPRHIGYKDAAQVIESIRREEFGLDPSLSNMESCMLKKQHARLGRALHCLSQELYSQDSHFLLELVQNADDNIYPENVEPTLTFILQETGIIVLNNEQGFSAQNIRALCDVGNSTKKGSGAGYIGQKGIGFKSVFRVTDAPEIHSNGFHVKFDIGDGQIGFVLPTIIPPCDIDLFRRLASGDTDQMDSNCWNTCIVLPFRSKFSEGTAMNNIMSMFSDLHPSLLLFLHRLQCIKFRSMLNNSLIVMRKEIVGNGIITVSHGKEKMTWLVVSQKLQADAIRPDVQTTEIALAFTLQQSDIRDCNVHLDLQPVFAFLPLRTYGLKFILQGDFVLPSSREEVDGDSPWNQWLLSEFPSLFVSAERSFCALPCFRENPGKGIAAYMSFVPLVGEVHGFFSNLPRMIISKLRMSNCLLLEGDNNTWVPPCKVLRRWNEQARIILPDSLLLEHLGLGFLDKDIVLSDPLARALGIEEYGPKILLEIISSLCHRENSLKSVGLGWLFSCLNELYTMSFLSSGQSLLNSGMELDLINKLRKIPFIPLSDGTYGSVGEGTIWLHSDAFSTGFDGEHGLEAFPKLYAKLRTVSPALLSAAPVNISCTETTSVDNVIRMLHRIGVQQLSAHEIVKVHILPAISDDRITNWDKNLMTEHLSFVMLHLHSSCPICRIERECIISELRSKALILTNHGYKRPVEVSIHFSKEYGNSVDVNKLIDAIDLKWHEIDITYLKHPITKSLSCGPMKWREFFQELGITDFVQIVQVEKSVIDISHTLLKNIKWDRELISLGSIAKDWESHELVHLLSSLYINGNREKCKYLLEVLDTSWDDFFSDKVTGYCNFKSSGDSKPFKSSFISSICDVRWIVSSMDDELHYPKDLFYDCDVVHSVLGASAPYAVPKVRSGKLLRDIGFKTQVTLDDILETLKLWRRLETPFRASIAQMSRLYTFIWNEMPASKQKIVEEFCSGPFIFVPYAPGSKLEDLVPGVLLSPEEVYWYDSSGSMDQMKLINPQSESIGGTSGPFSKTLCNFYPGLHDFFVNECGVHEIPPFRSYLHILQHLSTVALPSQAANAVFRVFLKWADGLKSGIVTSEDIVYLKECLQKLEFTVLPTVQDKWVSLHPSFGLVCWCDDENLRKEFKHLDNIDFLYFGELSNDENEMFRANVTVLMHTLEIPALSKVVTREAIYYGLADSSFKASLVDWALPYAQRYICYMHPDKYFQLKQSGFENLNQLQIVVVENLFYRNVIKRCDIASMKRFECNCLQQGNILYTTQESDSHSLFMELSRLIFDGTPELHLANFLHMITTMVESGSTEEQTEFFILNSQKVPKLPNEESLWSLSSILSVEENDETLQTSASTMINEENPSNIKKKPRINSNWPPVDWKTAPGFSFARANGFRTQALVTQPSSSSQKKQEEISEGIVAQTNPVIPIEIYGNWTIEDDSTATTTALILPDSEALEDQSDHACNQVDISANVVFDPIDLDSVSEGPESGSCKFRGINQLNVDAPNVTQALLTGRLGEHVAHKYFVGKVGKTVVTWVNEDHETGLPYDIVIGEGRSREYIEVKATKSTRKDWFIITTNEWQFAVDKGESFSIAHVVLSGNNAARITIFKNPAKLCQQRKLQLVVMMPKQRGFSVVS